MLNSSYFNICVTDCAILRKVGCTWLQRVSFFITWHVVTTCWCNSVLLLDSDFFFHSHSQNSFCHLCQGRRRQRFCFVHFFCGIFTIVCTDRISFQYQHYSYLFCIKLHMLLLSELLLTSENTKNFRDQWNLNKCARSRRLIGNLKIVSGKKKLIQKMTSSALRLCSDVEDKVTPHKRLKMDWLHEVDE